MKKYLRTNIFWGVSILIITFFVGYMSYLLGQIENVPDIHMLYQFTPTPTPDSRFQIGQTIPLTNLNIKLNDARRVPRTDPLYDLGVASITFSSKSNCFSGKEDCSFNVSNFRLTRPGQEPRTAIAPPSYYVPKLEIVAMTQINRLNGMSQETGQIYFHLDKQHYDYTLEYIDHQGKLARFKFDPVPLP